MNNGMNASLSDAKSYLAKCHEEKGKCATKCQQMPERTPAYPEHQPTTGGKLSGKTNG
jgi:hypothetical protein